MSELVMRELREALERPTRARSPVAAGRVDLIS